MEKGISQVAGRVDLKSGGSTLAYCALRPLSCVACGAVIPLGALFTRRKVREIAVNLMPRCQKCEPFTLRVSREEKSALLRNLLSEQPSTPLKNSGSTASKAFQENEKKHLEEMRKRLGPALKRGRRR